MAGLDAPTPARIGPGRPMGRSIALSGDPKGTGGERKAPSAPAGANPCPPRGMTRRLRRGRRACSPMGRSHFSFGGERKVYKRKPAARRLREKGFYCPFWRRGSLCRAQRSWPDYACHRARSELAFFRRQNGRAFFPPLPIAALLPRSWRWAYLPPCGDSASVTVGVEQSYPLRGNGILMLGRFWKVIGQRVWGCEP